MMTDTLAKKLTEACENAHVSVGVAARLLGIPEPAMLTGDLTTDQVDRLAHFLVVDFESLVTR